LLERSDGPFPIPARYPVAAGKTKRGKVKLPDGAQDVPAEPHVVGGRMIGIVDAAVDPVPDRLQKSAEQPLVHDADFVRRMDGDAGFLDHGNPPFSIALSF